MREDVEACSGVPGPGASEPGQLPVKLAKANEVNGEELLAFDKILITEKGLEQLAARIS